MKTSPAVLAGIVGRIAKACGGQMPLCAACESTNWSIDERLPFACFWLAEDTTNSNMAQAAMSLAQLTCQTCGNTLFFNLLSLGYSVAQLKGLYLPHTNGSVS